MTKKITFLSSLLLLFDIFSALFQHKLNFFLTFKIINDYSADALIYIYIHICMLRVFYE